MNIKELRIGNFVVAENKGWAVGSIDFFKNEIVLYNINMLAIRKTFKLDELNPIPVTDDWLYEFGVKDYAEDGSYHYFYNFSDNHIFEIDSNGQSNPVVECKYIHELQNAWLMLNGKELEIK